MLGLEYSGEDLKENLQTGLASGLVDFALNFPPGLITGLLLHWGLLPYGSVGWRNVYFVVGYYRARACRAKAFQQPGNAVDYFGTRPGRPCDGSLSPPLMAVLLVGGGAHKVIFSAL